MMGSLYLQPLREGFAAPDITSVLCADRAIWKFLTKACAERITPEPSANDSKVLVYPLLQALEKAFEDNEIKDYLRCQPKHLVGGAPTVRSAVTSVAAAPVGAPGGASKEGKKVKKKEKKAKAKAKAKAARKAREEAATKVQALRRKQLARQRVERLRAEKARKQAQRKAREEAERKAREKKEQEER